MTTIQLMACIGMVVGFFVLLGITPSDFTEGVFRQITLFSSATSSSFLSWPQA